jgi:hypothetical protein
VDEQVIQSFLANVLTPTTATNLLEAPPNVLKAGLSSQGMLQDEAWELEGTKEGEAGGMDMPQVRSWGTGIQYATQTRKVVGQDRHTQRTPADLDNVGSKLQTSVHILNHAKVDKHLRMMDLESPLEVSRDLGKTVPAPQRLLFHPMTTLQHDHYRHALGGTTDGNGIQVEAQL